MIFKFKNEVYGEKIAENFLNFLNHELGLKATRDLNYVRCEALQENDTKKYNSIVYYLKNNAVSSYIWVMK